jgi:thiamine-phosphate pyrophosphorylase
VLGGRASRFYPIIDAEVCDSHRVDPRAVASACLRGGATILQLRAKSSSSACFLALADAVVLQARTCGAIIIVNDRADVARMAGAGGVHVGQDDLPPEAVRAVLGPGLIGLSTHDERQVDDALASAADYLAVGPIYQTGTKDTGYSARGLALVRYATGRGKPVVAIGGIDIARAVDVIEAGASAVAVIRDVVRGDPEQQTRAYIAALQQVG